MKEVLKMSDKIHRFSVSQVTQGNHKFYTCTIPSDVLAKCCFVTTREDDPIQGFQRMLDSNRAQEIATYIDSGQGTIPSSIILSAQVEANLKIVGSGKTLEFAENPKSFLILDGQHRVYGFAMASSNLRVPVVIYNDLSRKDESRLFVDINSKQRGVPNELLLDIKQLAEYENNDEQLMREVFDLFAKADNSIFIHKFSSATKAKNKISRVTFNGAFKSLLPVFRGKDEEEVYSILNSYFSAFSEGLNEIECKDTLLTSVVFRGVMGFFPIAASKLKDNFGAEYTTNNFYLTMKGMFPKLKSKKFTMPGTSYKNLTEYLEDNFRQEFTL